MKIKKEYMFCFTISVIVFLFFAHTLIYPWRHFDEQIIYNETILPVPRSLFELFEYIRLFGLNSYFEASNPFYSSISNLRSDPFNFFIMLVVFLLFQKSTILYHLLSLIFHILSTCLLFLILNRIYESYVSYHSDTLKYSLISLLTLLWAFNPLNIESVLFTTNWSALFTYFLSLLAFYLTIKQGSLNQLLKQSIIFFIFLIALFTCEHIIMLPIILFCYLFGLSTYRDKSTSIYTVAKQTTKTLIPYILALIPFIIYFILRQTKSNLIPGNIGNINLLFERVFWLSPQIFTHQLKLIFFPLHLSIDQSSLVTLSKSLFSPYALFCISLMLSLMSYSILSTINLKKKWAFYFFILFVPFLISLIPFLHIISPLYNLVSERYFYFPLFFLTIGIAHVLFSILANTSQKKIITIISITVFITLSLSVRAYARTLDWRDSVSLFKSALREAKTDLIKGQRMQMLGGVLYSEYKDHESKLAGEKFILGGLDVLKNALIRLEDERIQYQDQIPAVIKFYGLDPKTMQAKIAYLIAFTKIGLGRNPNEAFAIMQPYMEDMSVIDTQILDLYIGLLFSLNKVDEAEKLLLYTSGKKLSPIILLPLAEIYKNKYHDFTKTEALLKEAFKCFPYESTILLSLKNLYLQAQNPYEFAYYSYLHGLRTHSKESLLEALKIYQSLYNQKMIDKISIELNTLNK